MPKAKTPAQMPAVKAAIPGWPELPDWAKLNQGHGQHLPKGRPFRHRGD